MLCTLLTALARGQFALMVMWKWFYYAPNTGACMYACARERADGHVEVGLLRPHTSAWHAGSTLQKCKPALAVVDMLHFPCPHQSVCACDSV